MSHFRNFCNNSHSQLSNLITWEQNMLGSALQPVKAEEMSSLMSVIYCVAAAAAYHSSFYMVNPTLVAVLQPIKMPPWQTSGTWYTARQGVYLLERLGESLSKHFTLIYYKSALSKRRVSVCVFEITLGKSILIMSSLSTVGLENMLNILKGKTMEIKSPACEICLYAGRFLNWFLAFYTLK